jgi:hypothetical protein
MNTRNAAVRLTREYRQTLHAAPPRVFSLLCPEREKEWLPGWDARMIHSESGRAEPRAIFASRDGDGSDIVWYTVAHEPPRRVRFVRWHALGMLVDIDLDLSSPAANTTWLDVRYVYTATSADAARRITAMTPEDWQGQMTYWESHLDAWLAAHPA